MIRISLPHNKCHRNAQCQQFRNGNGSSLVCNSDDRCYYSIYIDELNKYNTIPPETGDYHIKTLMYDPDISTLKIEDFEYTYKK